MEEKDYTFRGLRDDDVWVYGSFIKKGGKCYIAEESGEEWIVDCKTIGQFTEEQDINKKEIYEGHILTIWIGGYKQTQPYIVKSAKELYFERNRDDSYFRITKVEIIGDVFKNPNLIK